ncbi:MAG: DUF3570 domain-containing protein [Gammaproteobacteria bacterium]|nr:DUF3570 domain-containing protein [Gammaproteobacteria bacterium]
MNHKDSISISGALATATCTLLGSTASSPAIAQEEPDWDFNTSLLYYGEDGDRVQDFSVSAIARRMFVDDRFMTLSLTVDGLTGATPSGAIRQDVPQTFTRPSGNAAYAVPAGELPLDDTFRDTRVAISGSWQQPIGETSLINVGASASKEYDYLHLGLNAKYARDFNQRNTTLSAGIALSMDSFDPVGGAPTPLTAMLDVGDTSNRLGEQDKDVLDIVLGVTQVISRNLVVQANYSYSMSDGYLTDPYKVLSLVDGSSGDTLLRTPTPGVEGPSHQYLFESRPDERSKHSIYGQAKYYMNGKVLDASYRYMTDDWEIDSHTVDLRYRIPFGADSYIEPHLRFYTQTEAEFYQLSISDAQPLPSFASADYRLGNFDAITVGLKYGWRTRNDNEMSVRVETYRQTGTVPSSQIIGNQAARDNYPDLNAVIVQFGYRF